MRYFLLSIIFVSSLLSIGFPNEYYEIKDVKKMKNYFFNFMDNLITKQNNIILSQRKFIKYFYHKKDTETNNIHEYRKFKLIQKRYKLKDTDTLEKYLKSIDIIPNSLVLAQAAVESGWGKSRFVKQANNIFGQWTWTGKGLIPKSRDAGAKHKIKIFNSLEASVKGYMVNLNLGWGYKEFRNLRAKMRKNKTALSGLYLAKTLINYSQKKAKYTKLLATMIRQNDLKRFDK